MMMNSVPSNWKRRSQLSFPWVITITLLTRLHLRPIMHIAHPESVEDTISFIVVIIAKKNASLDYERGLHTFYLINSLSSSEGNKCKGNNCGKTNWKPKNEYKIRLKSHLRLPSQPIWKCLFSWFHIMKYRMVYFPWVILDQSIWGLWWAMVQLCADHLALRNHCLQNTPSEFPLTERIEGIIVKLSSWPSGMISYKDMTKIEMTSSRWQYWVELDTFLDVGKHPWFDIL